MKKLIGNLILQNIKAQGWLREHLLIMLFQLINKAQITPYTGCATHIKGVSQCQPDHGRGLWDAVDWTTLKEAHYAENDGLVSVNRSPYVQQQLLNYNFLTISVAESNKNYKVWAP